MTPQRQVYAFWYGDRIVTQVIASSEPEARQKADAESVMMADRLFEAPFERRKKLRASTVKTYPLIAQ